MKSKIIEKVNILRSKFLLYRQIYESKCKLNVGFLFYYFLKNSFWKFLRMLISFELKFNFFIAHTFYLLKLSFVKAVRKFSFYVAYNIFNSHEILEEM